MGTMRLWAVAACLAGSVTQLWAQGPPVGEVPLAQAGDVVRLPCVASAWLADGTPRERNSSAGKAPRLKLRNIQDFALLRVDARAVQGREIAEAALCLHRDGSDKLRYLRVSTVNQDWEQGESQVVYGSASGANFMLADFRPGANRSWAWPGSSAADVVMSAGNSLGCWSERKDLPEGWIAVPLDPQLIYALAVGDSDGLAVMDGGNPANHENWISSCQVRGYEPYVEVRLGDALRGEPEPPVVSVEPAPQHAHLRTGAVRVTIEPAANTFCWRLALNGRPVPRWCVKHPLPDRPTIFYLEDLPPGASITWRWWRFHPAANSRFPPDFAHGVRRRFRGILPWG